MTAPAFTPEQQAAIDARAGSVLVSAGAGTGKTSVLVERFARAVLEDGVEVEAILAITFTEKAAGELRSRVRARFAADGRHDAARRSEAAWISTIHGFCARVLRTHVLAAGLDPRLGVLDALAAERVALDAFDRALEGFLAQDADASRLRLLAAHTPDKLADMVRTAYAHQRSRGEAEPQLPEALRPRAAGEHEALGAAVAAAVAELAEQDGKSAETARRSLARCAAMLAALEPQTGQGSAAVADAAELRELALKGNAKALRGPACEAYRAAHEAYLGHCARQREYSDHVLLRDLIARYGRHYTALKRERSGLDFADLELLVRDLLRRDTGLRAAYSERFAHVMVDELQDTNPLQAEIVELIGRDNVFRVGDERQSIYRFRHADVEVFRSQRARAAESGGALAMSVNFRSRGELLDAIDLTFGRVWGEGFEPLRERPAARDAPPRGDPCVELLVTDRDKRRWDERFAAELEHGREPFGEAMRGVTPWRAAEARLLARRVDELVRDGPYEPGEVVLLLRATTHAGIYERALEQRGIPTYVVGGRGYFDQQQVGDLRAYLAALANPLDELALHSVLASPLAGVSLDSLVILAAAARRRGRDLWRMLEAVADGEGLELPQADAAEMRAFVARFVRERAAAPRTSLEALIDQAVTDSGYDRAVLALPAGDRRMANVRKLMRMAREFEAAEGRDLRAFIDYVAERELMLEREGEAPLEAEGMGAVRLMTVHRAKGLEFPVVCVADLGKRGREDDAALQITDDGRVGMRLASLGGGAFDSAELERIRARQKVEDEEEEKRIFYVAATRAQEHLVLSGATDLQKLPTEEALEEPMRWLWAALAPDLPDLGARGEAVDRYEGREVRVRCEILRPDAVDELLPPVDRLPVATEAELPGLEALAAPALAAVPVPEALPLSRISYSALAGYERCGYRFYLERVLGLRGSGGPVGETARARGEGGAVGAAPGGRGGGGAVGAAAGERGDAPGEDAGAPGTGAPAAGGSEGLPPLVRGAIVHALLEQLDFSGRRAAPSARDVAEVIESFGEPTRDADVADLTALVEGFAGSALFARIAVAERVRTELPFVFEVEARGRSLLVDGVVDVHASEPQGLLVVDYKSDRLEGREPRELLDGAYSTQRLVYALAALRAGAPRVEVVHLFLERPSDPLTATYEAADAAQLERRLLELASGVIDGRFEPTPNPHRGLCGDCPGQPALCGWGAERTLTEQGPS